MRTFTIDENNNITAFGSKEEAAGAAGWAFARQKELAKLSAERPIGRFVEIWNGFAGVAPFGELKPIKKFTDRKVATTRIWQAIQQLSVERAASAAEQEAQSHAQTEIPEPTEIAPEPLAQEVPSAVPEKEPETASVTAVTATTEMATVAPEFSYFAPAVAAVTAEASPAKNVPAADNSAVTKQPATKRKKAPKPVQDSAAPRETKLSQVVAMLQRPEGATITEIMQKMGWLKHTVRGWNCIKLGGATIQIIELGIG